MQNKTYIFPKHIVTMNTGLEILTGKGVEIENKRITGFVSREEVQSESEVINFPDYTLIPGFIQTHIHLCQTLFRGLADELQLLDWLQKKIFPMENAHDKDSLRASTQAGICELQKSGTTTIMDMGTLRHQEVIFEEMISSGIRGFAGKCMIDRNELYPAFCESAEETLNCSLQLAQEFHNADSGRIKYAFAPRFVLSCTENLLKDTFAAADDFDGALFHTHSSENKSEIDEVRRITGYENIEYFNKLGVLKDKTVLAHCIHLNEKEKQLLKDQNAAVAHCPSSNLKLGSGIADIPGFIENGIRVSIGADGAPCNNNLNVLTEMRLASLIQKPFHGPAAMDAKTTFKLATISGAEALGIADETGSIEPGKKADMVFINLNKINNTFVDDIENIYSDIVYSSDSSNIKEVMINGKWVVRKSKSVIFDEEEIKKNADQQLKMLLKRVTF